MIMRCTGWDAVGGADRVGGDGSDGSIEWECGDEEEIDHRLGFWMVILIMMWRRMGRDDVGGNWIQMQ